MGPAGWRYLVSCLRGRAVRRRRCEGRRGRRRCHRARFSSRRFAPRAVADASIDALHHRDVIRARAGRAVLWQQVPPAVARRRWLVRHLIRPVRCVVGDFEEEGTIGVLFDEPPQIRLAAFAGVSVVVDVAALQPEERVEAMRLGTRLRHAKHINISVLCCVVASALK
jgi:hypothetical protein